MPNAVRKLCCSKVALTRVLPCRRGGSVAPRGAVRMRLDGAAPAVPLPVTILWPGDEQV